MEAKGRVLKKRADLRVSSAKKNELEAKKEAA